jgi:hypothetical protein
MMKVNFLFLVPYINKVKDNSKSYAFKNFSAHGFRKVLLQCCALSPCSQIQYIYSRYKVNNSAVRIGEGKVLREFRHPVNCTIYVSRFRYRSETEYLDEIRKSLNSFPPCYSQSPLQLCLEISISSNSRNLLQFLQFSYCTL